MGVLAAVADAGLRVPEDMSLVGYDNTRFAALGPIGLITDPPAAGVPDQTSLIIPNRHDAVELKSSWRPHRHLTRSVFMAPRRNRPTALPRMAFLLTVGLAPLLLSAGPAQAAGTTAFARVTGDDDGYLKNFIYDGGPDRNDVKVVVAETGDFLWFVYLIDDIVPIRTGTNCVHPDSKDRTLVECVVQRATPAGYYLSTQIRLGANDDKLTFTDPLPESPKAIDLGAGDDTYVTTLPKAHDAYLIAGDGNDTLKVGKDAIVFAGAGDDKVTLIGGSAQVNGGDGNDLIKGGTGDDDLRGENGKDVIYGNKGKDLLVGNLGNDELHGGPGADDMQGNSGNDVLFGDAGNDRVSGGPGRDKVDGGTGQNTLVN